MMKNVKSYQVVLLLLGVFAVIGLGFLSVKHDRERQFILKTAQMNNLNSELHGYHRGQGLQVQYDVPVLNPDALDHFIGVPSVIKTEKNNAIPELDLEQKISERLRELGERKDAGEQIADLVTYQYESYQTGLTRVREIIMIEWHYDYDELHGFQHSNIASVNWPRFYMVDNKELLTYDLLFKDGPAFEALLLSDLQEKKMEPSEAEEMVTQLKKQLSTEQIAFQQDDLTISFDEHLVYLTYPYKALEGMINPDLFKVQLGHP